MANQGKKNKKDAYPSKKSINLYFKDDKTSKPSTIMLYCLFAVVVLLASAKLFVYDIWVEAEEQKKLYTQNENVLQQYLGKLSGFTEMKNQYNKYSYDYLHSDEILCDRIEVLEMLEETIGKVGVITSINIMGSGMAVEFDGVNLEQTALLAQKLEAYDMVQKLSISNASLSSKTGTYSVTMMITLTLEKEGGAK